MGVGELRFLDPQTWLPRRPTATESTFPGGDRPALEFDAEKVKLSPADPSVLEGGDAARNAVLLEELLDNRAPAGLRDTVCLNAGAALWVVGRTGNLAAGVEEARRLLASGEVKNWLKHAREFFRDVKP
jgi:anthranilate phosphoribosyltransferase